MEEQAVLLKERTSGKLFARVVQDNNVGFISFNFQIVAPTVGNYIYSLFQVLTNIDAYPLTMIYKDEKSEVNDEDELKLKMKEIFNHPDTIKKISTLLSY